MFSDPSAVELARALIDRFRFATLLVDRDLNVRLCNSAAAELLKLADGIQETQGELKLCCADSDFRLKAVLTEVFDSDGAKRSSSLTAPRPSHSSMWVLSLSFVACGPGASPTVLMSLFDPRDPILPDPCLFPTLFGLSHAEARIVAHLASGHSVASLARTLEIQPQTVRTHLKAVFRKTGVHRQQELVRLVTMLGLVR